MFTPLDIQKKTFSKSMSGYNRQEVEAFMKAVAEDMDLLLEERDNLKKQMKAFEQDLDRFTRIEKNINEALVVAQGTATSVLDNANKKASLMITEADYKARKLMDEARLEYNRIAQETETLSNEFDRFKTKLKALLSAEIDAIDRTFPDTRYVAKNMGVPQAIPMDNQTKPAEVSMSVEVPLEAPKSADIAATVMPETVAAPIAEPVDKPLDKPVFSHMADEVPATDIPSVVFDPVEALREPSVLPASDKMSIEAVLDALETVTTEKARAFEKVNPETEYTQKYDYDRIAAIRSKIFEGEEA